MRVSNTDTPVKYWYHYSTFIDFRDIHSYVQGLLLHSYVHPVFHMVTSSDFYIFNNSTDKLKLIIEKKWQLFFSALQLKAHIWHEALINFLVR